MRVARYVEDTDVAKTARNELKHCSPSCKFSLRTHLYTCGSSIDVSRMDGLTVNAIGTVIGKSRRTEFEGMQHLQCWHNNQYQGETLYCGNGYEQAIRTHSSDSLRRTAIEWEAKCGFEAPELIEGEYGVYLDPEDDPYLPESREHASQVIM
ncbi:hypothetical protein E3J62_11400 [candidate division TA06 bacterium]|uniref:Large polyvalent protein associated domain-containing protein n=1 Tax=candidate division TA06 bacterium TaxID=2250710 RepID=A0A523UND3_UNCT6|nr:MAG: hypothetical protein E3J62_11400 [candidate division TA06 bacterium]